MSGERHRDLFEPARFGTAPSSRRPARLFILSSVLALLAGTMPAPTRAQAQRAVSAASESPVLEEVVVTGSRLPDRNIQGANPVTIIGSDQFEELAPVSLQYELQRQPDVRIQGSSGGTTAGSQ